MNRLLSNIINSTRPNNNRNNIEIIINNPPSLSPRFLNTFDPQSSFNINQSVNTRSLDVSNTDNMDLMIQGESVFNQDISVNIDINNNENIIETPYIVTEPLDIIDNEYAVTGTINNSNTINESSVYYSQFSYNESDLRYYHDYLLDEQETNTIIDYIVQNITNDQLNAALNDTQPEINYTNDDDYIDSVLLYNTECNFNKNLNIKNDVCPISLEEFKDNEEIYVLKNCNHAISKEMFITYVKTFNNCPLCKEHLINML